MGVSMVDFAREICLGMLHFQTNSSNMNNTLQRSFSLKVIGRYSKMHSQQVGYGGLAGVLG